MKIVITENQLKNLIKKDIMVEGKQVGILYHTTSNKQLFKIIQENKLNAFSNDFNNSLDYRNKLGRDLKVTFAGPILTNKEKYPPYISFTRNKNYKRASTDSVLVIDGDKLSERYKIRPYSHFGGRKNDEMEERIYRDVVDLDKYIIKVILPNENEELELLLNEKGIKYEINDIKNIMSKEIREQINISRIKQVMESDPKVGTGKKPEGSGRRLYTDENPNDTVSVKFRTKEDIVDTLNKESFKSKSHKRQSQIINLIHQRVRAAYQNTKDTETKKRLKRGLDYIESEKEKSKEKTIKLQKQEQTEVELTEKCWKGYTQKGMKIMFGKRYPNCVKKTK